MDARKMVGSIALLLSYLRWGWEILLHTCFFQPHSHSHLLLLHQHPTAAAARYEPRRGGEEEVAEQECVVCLSKIEEGDEVPELTCHHLFHKVCLDRWTHYSFFNRRRHATCPLCRRSLTAAAAGAAEVLVFDYASLVCSDDSRQTWWLR